MVSRIPCRLHPGGGGWAMFPTPSLSYEHSQAVMIRCPRPVPFLGYAKTYALWGGLAKATMAGPTNLFSP